MSFGHLATPSYGIGEIFVFCTDFQAILVQNGLNKVKYVFQSLNSVICRKELGVIY